MLRPRVERIVRCPDCRQTYRTFVPEVAYRAYVTTRFDYFPFPCQACSEARCRSLANGLPVAENRNPERAAD